MCVAYICLFLHSNAYLECSLTSMATSTILVNVPKLDLRRARFPSAPRDPAPGDADRGDSFCDRVRTRGCSAIEIGDAVDLGAVILVGLLLLQVNNIVEKGCPMFELQCVVNDRCICTS